IDPRSLMLVERGAREKGLDVIGYYHSHPDDEPVPSQFDLDHALPVWSYIIVSVREQKAVDWNSWEMENDRSKFNKEEAILGDKLMSVTILIPTPLRQFAGGKSEVEVAAGNVSEALNALTTEFTELRKHLYTEQD